MLSVKLENITTRRNQFECNLVIRNNNELYNNYTIRLIVNDKCVIEKCANFGIKVINSTSILLTPNDRSKVLTISSIMTSKMKGTGTAPISAEFIPEIIPIPPINPPNSNYNICLYVMPGIDIIRKTLPLIKDKTNVCFVLSFWNTTWDSGIPDNSILSEIINNGNCFQIAFGGYSGCKDKNEASLSGGTVSEIIDKYLQPINQYTISSIDLDIEMDAELDVVSYKKRNRAISAIQKQKQNLRVSYTIPSDDSGIYCLEMLKDAMSQGVVINEIRLMLMDFGKKIDLVNACVSGLQNAYKQLKDIGLGEVNIGFIPLLMRDDDKMNVYTLDIHKQILQQIKSMPYVKTLCYWELAIDMRQNFDFLKSYISA